MISLNDIILQLKAALSKEDFDRQAALSLVERIEPMAARDWARIKKLERRMEAFSGGNPEELEQSLKELEGLKSELDKARQIIEEKDRQIQSINKERAERETALAQILANEKAAVARLLLDAGLTAELSKANIKPSLLPAAKALIREKGILSVEGEGEVRTAVGRATYDALAPPSGSKN